jgi:hypothetical protein
MVITSTQLDSYQNSQQNAGQNYTVGGGGAQSCANQLYPYYTPTYYYPVYAQSAELEFLVKKLMESTEEIGRLKAELERLKKKNG